MVLLLFEGERVFSINDYLGLPLKLVLRRLRESIGKFVSDLTMASYERFLPPLNSGVSGNSVISNCYFLKYSLTAPNCLIYDAICIRLLLKSIVRDGSWLCVLTVSLSLVWLQSLSICRNLFLSSLSGIDIYSILFFILRYDLCDSWWF